VDSFEPPQGWPGTILDIAGSRFGATRDENTVVVGGERALVLSASATRLRVATGPRTARGPVEVTVAGRTGRSASEFKLAPHPDQGDLAASGPPILFSGPQTSTPQPIGLNQRVLVVLVNPSDVNLGDAAARQNLRQRQIDGFAETNRYFREVSYGRTSFDFTVTDWFGLPRDNDFYVWQHEDVERARRDLYRGTLLGIAAVGQVIYLAHDARLSTLGWAGGMSAPMSLGGRALGSGNAGTAVRLAASQAFVGLGAGGLRILDVSTPAMPADVATVPLGGGYVHDLHLTPDHVLTACEDRGLRIVDRASRTDVGDVATGSSGGFNWALGVRVTGNHALVAAGDGGLVVVDFSNPAAPTVAAEVGTDAFAVGLDVAGSLAVVATDGDGLKVFDVSTPTAPALRSTFRGVGRPRAVALRGSNAFVAAQDQGLRVVDLSNPAQPAEIANAALSSAVFTITIDGDFAYLGGDDSNVHIVDIRDPRRPQTRSGFDLAMTTTVDLDRLRGALDAAIRNQGFLQRGDEFWAHSLEAAQSAGFNLRDFEGYIIVQAGTGLRGQSGRSTARPNTRGGTIDYGGLKGELYIDANTHVGRRIHEISHWFDLPDVYEEGYPDGTLVVGTASRWDLMGDDNPPPLYSGHYIEKLGLYSAANVVRRGWTPAAPAVDETFTIVAHGRVEDGGAGVHLLHVDMPGGVHYYVEVRQRPDPAEPTPVGFDADVPVPTDAAHPWQGGVLITRAIVNSNHANTRERIIQMADRRVLQPGDEFVDAARNLRVRVEARTADRPLAFRVRLSWNMPVGDTPGAPFDPHITEWTTDHWESVDIWVNSRRNDPGPTPQYEFHQQSPEDPTIPRLNGDRPWVGRPNKIFARVRNTGTQEARDVWVSFYTNSPPGIGDNGSWALRETKLVDRIPPNGETIVDADWVPDRGEHTCLQVHIAPQIGEANTGNNKAQENVFTFDTAGASSHEPVELETVVRNPYTIWKLVHLVVRGLDDGWHALLDHAWVWVPPLGERPLRVVLWTVRGTSWAGDREREIPQVTTPQVEGWADRGDGHWLEPIGGITAIVKATRKVEVRWEVEAAVEKPADVTGCLKPALADVPITVEVTAPDGKTELLHTHTDADGCFSTRRADGRQPFTPEADGEYCFQVFVSGGGDAAESETEVRAVAVS
jgi:hypothetical protein